MSTKTIAPAVTTSDAAMMDAQVQAPGPHELTKETHVSAKTWAAMGEDGRRAHVVKLRKTHDQATTTKREMVANLVLVAARLYKTEPESFQAKNGNFKGSALVDHGLGLADLSKGSDIRTAINKCVPAVVDSGLSLYGEPSAKLVALLNAYDVNAKHRKARERNRAARAGKSAEAEKSEEAPAARETDKQEAHVEAPSWSKVQSLAVSLAEAVQAMTGGAECDPETEVQLIGLLEATIESIRSN